MVDDKFQAFLERIKSATGIENQTDLAASLNIHRSAITQARKKAAIPDKWLVTLYRKFGLNPEWLETGRGLQFLKEDGRKDDEFYRVPKVYARLSAGGGSFESNSAIEGYYSFRKEWLWKKGPEDQMVMMDVTGNSMEPELKDGDTVLLDQSKKEIIAGAIYAVGVDDTILIKRVEKLPNTLVLQSDNTHYSPIFIKGEGVPVRKSVFIFINIPINADINRRYGGHNDAKTNRKPYRDRRMAHRDYSCGKRWGLIAPYQSGRRTDGGFFELVYSCEGGLFGCYA